jgi:hypothetical protein
MTFQFFKSHTLDQVLINHDRKEQFLHIPVNASSWGKTIFKMANFQSGMLHQDYRTIIFFRDPIDRWLSGVATWLTSVLPQHTNMYNIKDNQAVLDILFSTVRQDEHTERQAFFVQNVNWNNTICFYIDSNFNQAICKYFQSQYNIDISNVPPEHQTTLEGGKLIPKTYFKSVLESNYRYFGSVKSYFKIDYDMIKNIKFENPSI